jgi:hypothetical protein
VDSCRRFLQKVNFEPGSSKKTLTLFSKLSHAYPDEYHAIFKKAHAEMIESPSPPQDYIDLKGWLEEKLRLTSGEGEQ